MGTTFNETVIQVAISVTTTPVVAAGLGLTGFLVPAGTTPIAGGYTSYSTPEDVAAALAADELTAQGAADITMAMSQADPASSIYVATYDDASETPDDALDTFVAAGIDVGVIGSTGRDLADIAALGTWAASGSTRKWDYLIVAQSADASLRTGTPSATLDPFQVSSCHLISGAADEEPMGALVGAVGGASLAIGPISSRLVPLAANPEDVSTAERDFIEANNCNVLLPQDVNSTASQFLGRKQYDGTSFKAVTTLMYLKRVCVAAIQQLTNEYGIKLKPIPKDARGVALFQSVVDGAIAPLAAVDHFSPGNYGSGNAAVDLPDGYRVLGSVEGDNLVCRVQCLISGEPFALEFNVEAQVN